MPAHARNTQYAIRNSPRVPASARPRVLPRSPRPAFTLVEVLIAVAIALLLIVGISQIFAIAQRTTSMGTALLTSTAQDRSLQNTLNRDLHAILPMDDSPGFVLASYAAAMFRNKSDYDSSPTQGDPTNFGPNFTNPSAPYSQAFSTNSRIHRLDRMCFFARDLFRRQTADSPNVSSFKTSTEGFIWYGHLALPNNPAISTWDPANPGIATGAGAAWFNPGVPAITSPINDNNQFASQMILGRQVMVMLPAPTTGPPPESGFMPNPPAGPFIRPYTLLLDPTNGRPATCVDNSGTVATLFASRYDICYNTIADWNNLISVKANFPPNSPWWQQISGLQFGAGLTGDITADQRYYANPFPTKPDPSKGPLDVSWNSAASAQTAPIFVRGCSQFIVEFAGDFTSQDLTGNVISGKETVQDHQIDFIVDPSGQRRIRWYGLPRDTGSTNGANQPDGTIDNADVMPVGMFTGIKRPFERQLPTSISPGATTWKFANGVTNGGNPAQNLPMHSQAYVCAWGSDIKTLPNAVKPTMIRITIAVDDANGRLNNEQTYEYIFTLP
jgi:prepilin-type N-terminal cleavage/methylation domain-containing protein